MAKKLSKKKMKRGGKGKSHRAHRMRKKKSLAQPKRLLKSGVKGLDVLFGGGIPEGTATLVTGLPHCGKKPLMMQAIYKMLRMGKPVIFVLTDFGVMGWKDMMLRSNWDIGKYSDNIYFVDCYTQQYGACPVGDNITCLQVPFLLSSLSIETSNFIDVIKAKTKRKPFVVLHSISTLVEDFGEIETFKFIQFLVGRLRAEGATVLMSAQSGAKHERVADMLQGIFDYVVEMRDMRMRVSGYGATNEWVAYTMERTGIICHPPAGEDSHEGIKKKIKSAHR